MSNFIIDEGEALNKKWKALKECRRAERYHRLKGIRKIIYNHNLNKQP